MTFAPQIASLPRLAAIGLTLVATALVSSCGTPRPDMRTTNSIPDDYRTRHPISLAEVQHNLDVPIAAGDHSLSTPTRDLIRGFAQDYTALSSGTVQIAVPVSAANSAAAQAVKTNIRKVLTDAGVKPARIVLTSYSPASAEASAPVRLSFVAVTAMTDDCGQWPTDLFGPTITDNTNWENFGCASQQNLAAQIANPADLVGPRGMTPIDAQRRAEVIRVYREE